MDLLATEIAHILLDVGAVGFTPDAPVTFKSGIQSPVYTDNRRLPFNPTHWKRVIEGFGELLLAKNITYDAIGGLESAGIPHSSALGYSLNKPSVFVRKEAKGHGKQKRIEGGSVKGLKILLIEDLVTTGSSSLSGVDALREAGATVTDCLAITTYDFPETRNRFAVKGVRLHTLTTFSHVWEEARRSKIVDESVIATVENWFKDPYKWGQT